MLRPGEIPICLHQFMSEWIVQDIFTHILLWTGRSRALTKFKVLLFPMLVATASTCNVPISLSHTHKKKRKNILPSLKNEHLLLIISSDLKSGLRNFHTRSVSYVIIFSGQMVHVRYVQGFKEPTGNTRRFTDWLKLYWTSRTKIRFILCPSCPHSLCPTTRLVLCFIVTALCVQR